MALFSHIKRKMLMISMNMVKWCIYIGNFWVAFYRYRYGYIGTNTDTDIYIGIGASLKIMCLACCYMIKPPGFLIRSYGTPNGPGRCPVSQCCDKIWATMAQQ